jgi:protein kinase-like protein/tetratricopeptide repeat protein
VSLQPPSDTVGFLRDYLATHPDDLPARLRLAQLLVGRGERGAARALLEPLERPDTPAAAQAQITAELAILDEEEGLTASAIVRWERLLADDIDHAEARAHLGRLRASEPLPAAPPTSAQPTLGSPEGMTLLRYQIVREIGRGGTSTVYLARDQRLEIELALKVLHPQLAAFDRSDACRRFFHEARVAAGLRHPGVVAIYDLDEETRTLVMEHLPGGSLRDRLQARPAAEAMGELRALASTLLSALSYVHARGVVHGDITPRNVLLRRPGDAVLADFGNARLIEGTAAIEGAGTPIYLAPEQFRGAPPSPAADLFATGAVLWEALVGRPMRKHGDLAANRFGTTPLPAEARAGLRGEGRRLAVVIEAMTAAEEKERPTAVEALRVLGA